VQPIATGQGVIKRPVSTGDWPSTSSRKNGSETNVRFCAVNEQIEFTTESAKTGRAKSSSASIG
jgi:hypothetical protein